MLLIVVLFSTTFPVNEHSWRWCTWALTNMHSDWMFSASSGILSCTHMSVQSLICIQTHREVDLHTLEVVGNGLPWRFTWFYNEELGLLNVLNTSEILCHSGTLLVLFCRHKVISHQAHANSAAICTSSCRTATYYGYTGVSQASQSNKLYELPLFILLCQVVVL